MSGRCVDDKPPHGDCVCDDCERFYATPVTCSHCTEFDPLDSYRMATLECRGWFWWVVYPAVDGGMSTETGPHLTHLGARLSRWAQTRAWDEEQAP